MRSRLTGLLRRIAKRSMTPPSAPANPPSTPAAASRWRTDAVSIARHQPAPLRAPPGHADANALRLHWILPDAANRSGGGHMTLFRLIRHLEQRGHQQQLWLRPPWFHATASAAFETFRAYQPLGDGVSVDFLPDDVSSISGDAVIATDWWTVYPAIAVSAVRERFYVVQDLESAFLPIGAEALLAEQTYRLGLKHLCAGRWLHQLIEQRHGGWSWQWELACDTTHYYPPASDNAPAHISTQRRDCDGPRDHTPPPRIAFYYRAETPRRAVELGLAAFDLLHARGIAFHVDFFGSPAPAGLPYAHHDHGVLDPAALGALYRAADLGLVFSATNYSLVPLEMMACGLAVAELQGDSTDAAFPPNSILRLPPWPPAIAEQLAAALSAPDTLAAQRDTAHAFVSALSWTTTGQRVEQGLLAGLGITPGRHADSANKNHDTNSRGKQHAGGESTDEAETTGGKRTADSTGRQNGVGQEHTAGKQTGETRRAETGAER